jgi:TatD DNase family protein
MVVPAVGIHPTNILQASVADFESVERWASMPQVAAIGETGLDFYWESTPHERQREVFQWHLDLARRLGLPVTVHSRNAEDAVLEELRLIPPPGGVLHCFGGARDVASRALDMGLYIGVDGPVTYKKSCDLQDLVRWLPLDRMLVETDSPYLSPHPFRGKLNDPSRLLLIVEKIAELRKITSQEVARATTNNAFHLFPRLASRIRVSRSIPEE